MNIVRQVYQKIITTKNFGQCMRNVQLLSAGDGNCKAQFTVSDEHVNVMGTLHGGFTSTVIDCVSGYALASVGTGALGVSVDLHVTFMKTASIGEVVTIDASTKRVGKKLAFLTVELTKNEGKDIVALGQHTKYFI
ncbi:PREDICTED: acyl-coenzyme A thioesterase 13-like isoform X2 [Dinoponera quadriceps]|uniref:Acyl-coenzyme A thioesterase 13-like isoform X2 n=1 Tax=Dinoponera quadriceps TaxID=609295 RepID=A0A6P3Y7S8_DINQU|nr:PREDICTED: acyl-coenzyme A thioesterase 13-like isoform X2 [Dinoponera quadriceps]